MFNAVSNAACNNTVFMSMKMTGMHETAERLFLAAKVMKETEGQSAVARLLNESPQSLTNWEKRGLSKRVMIKAQSIIGCSASWLETGLGEMFSTPGDTGDGYGLTPIAVWEHPEELPDGEFIKVPRLDVRLSAGNGNGEHPEVDLVRENPQVFRAEWARRERLKPSALSSMYAHGRSMEPRICDGDSLLVDTSQTVVLDGRVYAIWYAGELRVKRLFKRVDGGITINSDNDDFPRVDVLPDEMEHVRIIGRVVHVQGTGGL